MTIAEKVSEFVKNHPNATKEEIQEFMTIEELKINASKFGGKVKKFSSKLFKEVGDLCIKVSEKIGNEKQ